VNYLVWIRGLRGPEAQLQLLDPRSSIDWKTREGSTIAIFKLKDYEHDLTLDQAIAAYPCPEA
jgi:hypothetical protein